MTTAMITSKNVSFRYPHEQEPFLQNINLEIQPGECVLICGHSGSGKTTFSRLLNGLSPNYIPGELQGEVTTNGLLAGQAAIEDYVPVVGSVFQNPKTQYFTATVKDELAFPLENSGIAPVEIVQKVQQTAAEFHIAHLLDRQMFSLSGGEQQQIALAAATILHPKVLVLDEVSSNLDDQAITRLTTNIRSQKAAGVTIILTEHRLAWTTSFVDRYVLFQNGALTQTWTKQEFLSLSQTKLHDLGLRAVDLTAQRQALAAKTYQPNTSLVDQTKTFAARQLTIGYQPKQVLTELSFGLKPHQVTGVIGPNGVGKSTLAKTLTGLLKPMAGQILWHGHTLSAKELLKKSFLVMQNTNYQLFCESVEEEVLLHAKYPERKDELLTQLNLAKFAQRHPLSLSAGQQQRVVIAAALMSGKELLIFDEPTSGLDYANLQRFGDLLQLLKQTETLIVVITHDLELSAGWCDQVIQLRSTI